MLVLLFVVSPLLVFAGSPIQDLLDNPVPIKPDGSMYSVEDVKNAIIKACQERGWTPKPDGDSKVIASILVRNKHYAEIEIAFTTSTYSIRYLSSRNLDYDEEHREIHRNYNKWVVMLSSSIQRQFGVRSQMF